MNKFDELQSLMKTVPPDFKGFTGFDAKALEKFYETLPKNYYDASAATRTLLLIAMLWVTRKISAKTICITLPTSISHDLQWIKNELPESDELSGTVELTKSIKGCPHKYLITNLVVARIYPDQRFAAHANVLLIDLEEKIAIRYEPHGDELRISELYDYDSLDKHLAIWFQSLGIRYNGDQSCRSNGLQRLQQQHDARLQHYGTCEIWSIYFMHMRIIKPDIPALKMDTTCYNGLLASVQNLSEFIMSYAHILLMIGLLLCKHVTRSQLSLQQMLDEGAWGPIVTQHLSKLFRYAMFS
jgi:hypothetical protein